MFFQAILIYEWKKNGFLMRKLAIGRLTGVIRALLSILCAVFFYSSSNYVFEQFQKWTTARPMTTEIDFSQPGTITVPFRQTCSISHGEGIFLDHDIKDENGALPIGSLSGLSARIVIHDQEGNEIVRRALVDNRDRPFGHRIVRVAPEEILLADIPTFKMGQYTATITIDEGLPLLTTPQTIYAKYQLCGCEQMVGLVFVFYTLCAGIIGFVAALVVAPGLWQSGIWRDVKVEVKPESDMP
ncbi:MAG: hypothetical protein K0U86_06720 [Planctomycetes bacterium]|nr:hypothetical protein [Planctomycetota bacterium]MCH9724581.1 hypothetical protein [Planctomycetota bacterium]MCH9777869.1 hypothetical protein [Planctomycetota bacterium]MCH9793044.1 hypothetical protein [Planctomycetota bacterium]